jgi:hypothetical protein
VPNREKRHLTRATQRSPLSPAADDGLKAGISLAGQPRPGQRSGEAS